MTTSLLNGLPGVLDMRLTLATYMRGMLTPGELTDAGVTPTVVNGSNITFTGNLPNIVVGDADPNNIFTMLGDDWIRGGAGNDTIAAGGGDDYLDGGAGNDVLLGGGGQDALVGGAGADTLDGGGDLDTAVYAASNAAVNINLAAGTASGGHAQGDVLISIEAIVGSNFNDTITGDGRSNILYGGRGNDILDGGDGNDILYGDVGNDTLLGGRGVDYLEGGAGADLIDGGDAFPGNWALYSLSASGVLIDLSTGTANGGDATGDTIVNISNVAGSRANDTLTGDSVANSLSGNNGNDILSGLAGADLIDGGAGNDTIIGGLGSDVMIGGAGSDLFQVDVSDTDSGADTIEDFRKGADKLELTLNGDTANIAQSGADTVITFADSAQTITLLDTSGLVVGTDILFV